MNYKKLKPEVKMKYIHNHIAEVKEHVETLQQHIKWALQDIKFIESISEPEKTQPEPQ